MIESFNIQYHNKDDLLSLGAKLSSHPPDQLLIQVFSGVTDEPTISKLIRELGQVFPAAPVLGTTTAGEIVDGVSLERTITINVTRFESTRVRTALVTQNEDLLSAGRQLGSSLRTDAAKVAPTLARRGHP
jgi:hypothetical protein